MFIIYLVSFIWYRIVCSILSLKITGDPVTYFFLIRSLLISPSFSFFFFFFSSSTINLNQKISLNLSHLLFEALSLPDYTQVSLQRYWTCMWRKGRRKDIVATCEGKAWRLPCWHLNETAAKKPLLTQRCVQDLLDVICFH